MNGFVRSLRAGNGRDWWIPWTFVAFFAVVFAVNGVMVYFALESWTGLSERDAYEKGIAYNETLAEEARQKALGWAAGLAIEPRIGGRTAVAVRLTDRTGHGLLNATVSARFVRPTSAGHDVRTELTEQGGGRYTGRATVPMAGIWDLRIEATLHGNTARWTRRVMLP